MTPRVSRRGLGLLGAGLILGASGSQAAATERRLPIVFVHGNGDSSALWVPTLWRFESLGWPRHLLFPIDLRPPTGRTVDSVPQEGRSGTTEAREQLAAFVRAVLAKTGAAQVALVGNSRGCNVIRNYLKNGGGAPFVSAVVLGGGVHRGVVNTTAFLVGSEFNGSSDFIQQLNAGPNEIVPGPRFLTLRSDRLDKFAQPDGRYIGAPGFPTGITYSAPALKGATNRVLDGTDHREVAYGPRAFAQTWQWLTGARPKSTRIVTERRPVLNGLVTGITAGVNDNGPVAGAEVSVYAVDPRTGIRRGAAKHRKVTGADGAWGPFRAQAGVYYEFVVTAAGYPITHIYRSPFPRSSSYIGLRLAFPVTDPAVGSYVEMSRPRGYFGVGRDVFTLDGVQPPSIPVDPVPSESTAVVRPTFLPQRTILARFNREQIAVRNWPEGHVSTAEFHF